LCPARLEHLPDAPKKQQRPLLHLLAFDDERHGTPATAARYQIDKLLSSVWVDPWMFGRQDGPCGSPLNLVLDARL
jgi:hypothetical protein